MALINLSAADFLFLGLELVGFSAARQASVCDETNTERFLSSYPITPAACSSAFYDLQTTANDAARIDDPVPFYFLVALNWMRTYKTEHEISGLADLDPTTLRVHIRKYTDAFAALKEEKIIWSDYDGFEIPWSVDGVHCLINEPRRHPDRRWKSFKLQSAGVAYEVLLALHEDQVVNIRGPFKAGTKDLDIFTGDAETIEEEFEPEFNDNDDDDEDDDDEDYEDDEPLITKIPDGKMAVADKGYIGAGPKVCLHNPCDTEEVKAFKRRAGARHESFNKRLKTFKVLDQRFRHGFHKHKSIFLAACVLVQYDMENGRPLFEL